MVRLALLTFCLTFFFALDSAISWGNSGGSLETGSNIPNSNENIQIPDQIDRIIEDNSNVVAYVQSNPSYSSYGSYFPYIQPRIATPSARVTITYTLGKRISGKEKICVKKYSDNRNFYLKIRRSTCKFWLSKSTMDPSTKYNTEFNIPKNWCGRCYYLR